MAQKISGLGMDMATLVFHVVGRDHAGPVVRRQRLARSEVPRVMAPMPPRRIGLEAWGSAHDWARRFRAHGQDVRLIAPPCSKASVKSPKHDARDAAAICEAVTRPTRRGGPSTRGEPQDLQALHRVRERLVKARTALVHAIRGRRHESGRVLPQGSTPCRRLIVPRLEADEAQLTPCRRERCRQRSEAFLALDQRLASYGEPLTAIGQAHPACQRRQTIPGMGPVRATALIAARGEATPFQNGRQRAAWLGVGPREHATGGKPRRLGSSTRGDVSLRTVLVQGARATLRWVDTKPDDRRRWLRALIARRGKNRAAVA